MLCRLQLNGLTESAAHVVLCNLLWAGSDPKFGHEHEPSAAAPGVPPNTL
jgi:hypothetical protein